VVISRTLARVVLIVALAGFLAAVVSGVVYWLVWQGISDARVGYSVLDL
jgi:hypothetical protein